MSTSKIKINNGMPSVMAFDMTENEWKYVPLNEVKGYVLNTWDYSIKHVVNVPEGTEIRGEEGVFSENGYEVRLEGGVLHFECSRYYSSYDGEVSIDAKFTPNGWFVVEYKEPDKKAKVLRKRRVANSLGEVSGTIGLQGGHISDRKPYFRDEKFQEWLDAHGITAVMPIKNLPVNSKGEITLMTRTGWSTGDKAEELYSDAKIVRRNAEPSDFEYRRVEDGYWVEFCSFAETPTWVIHDSYDYRMDNRSSATILYTNAKDVTELDIPVIK